jgi:hypothetical protein
MMCLLAESVFAVLQSGMAVVRLKLMHNVQTLC